MKKNLFLVGILVLQTSVFISSDSDSAAGSIGSSRAFSVPGGRDSVVSVGSIGSLIVEPTSPACSFGGWMREAKSPGYSGVNVDGVLGSGAVAQALVLDFNRETQVYSRGRRPGVFEAATQTPDNSSPTTQIIEGGSPIASPRISMVETPAGVLTHNAATGEYGILVHDAAGRYVPMPFFGGRRLSAVVYPEAVVAQVGAQQTPPPVQQVGASGWCCGCFGK